MSKSMVLVASLIFVTGVTVLAQQRSDQGAGPGPGGPPGGRGAMPAYYTNRMMPLGPVATAAAERACPSRGHTRLVCLADLLKKDLSPELLARLQLPYSVADAQRWSNFPPMAYRNRIGPTLAEFTPAQLGVVKAMLKQAAGMAANEGFDEIEQILNADDYLQNNTRDAGFASGNFQIAFIGTPSEKGQWQLYFGGHHLAFSNTYKDGALTGATPSFRGVEPFTAFRENGRDNAPMAQEQAAFASLLTALTPAEQAKAKLTQTYTDIIVGPQRDDNFPAKRTGIAAAELKDAQRTLLLRAIETYVGDIDPPDAAKIIAKYRAELAETFISFSGTPGLNAENDYVRIDGPSVWIEYSLQPGRSLPGIHPHSVWRDRGADYGGNK
jgi:hypothetical protein